MTLNWKWVTVVCVWMICCSCEGCHKRVDPWNDIARMYQLMTPPLPYCDDDKCFATEDELKVYQYEHAKPSNTWPTDNTKQSVI